MTAESVGTEIKKLCQAWNKSKRNHQIKKPRAMLCRDEKFQLQLG